EEGGLHGAYELVARGPVPRSAMAANVNIDMIGRDAGHVLYAAGTHHYAFLEPYLQGVARPPVVLRLGHDSPNGAGDWTKDSDHYAFHRSGIPFLYFGVEDSGHHHRTTDDAESIQKEFLAGAVETIIAVLERLDADLEKISDLLEHS
ncbi:MAG TPA: M28 family peptidase, partial [Vicinamibacterales bacterium]|nr:M28 family peptidase [Vicinamibacterales bacterium]